MTVHKFWLFITLMLTVLACKDGDETVQMKYLNGSWNKSATQHFHFKIGDSQHPKNIIFVIRNNNEYPYSNIRLIAKLNHGKSVIKTDTLNYILAQPDGSWLGKGFGETKEILFQYKINYKFPQNGDYVIGITQAMRADHLKGIEDIGVKIETPKP